ncbi:hypothetical protein Q7P37_009545 [Cladosporium fusiforme]
MLCRKVKGESGWRGQLQVALLLWQEDGVKEPQVVVPAMRNRIGASNDGDDRLPHELLGGSSIRRLLFHHLSELLCDVQKQWQSGSTSSLQSGIANACFLSGGVSHVILFRDESLIPSPVFAHNKRTQTSDLTLDLSQQQQSRSFPCSELRAFLLLHLALTGARDFPPSSQTISRWQNNSASPLQHKSNTLSTQHHLATQDTSIMSGWDDVTPAAATTDVGFTADTTTTNDAWGAEEDIGYIGQNVSKHARDGDDLCRNCGGEGHFARDCLEPRKEGANSGLCYNCNEPGHNKADCPNPPVEREFTGECRGCGQTGHRKADCPDKGPEVCRACKKEGHVAADCDANRLFTLNGIEDVTSPEEAWEALKAADASKESVSIKKALFSYAKSVGNTTFQDIELAFRQQDFNTHLIAKQQDVAVNWTLVNFQGKTDQKYTVAIQWSAKPRRAIFAEGWPASPEENLSRLAEAGFPMDSFVIVCDNCGEVGHVKSKCDQEKREVEKVVETCVNCDEVGHRARDCTQPRKQRGGRGCRNCGQEGHISRECPEPPNMDNVECKGCGQMGHFSRDCPDREPDVCHNCGEEGHRARDCEKERVVTCRNCDQQGHISKECPEPRNMAKVQCRNCDEFGHTSRECPKPTDWSRVECTNCHEKGHSYKKCPNPAAAEAEGDGGW